MSGILETLAFTLVIAGQFFAAIVTTSQRKMIYFDSVPEASDEAAANSQPELMKTA